MIMEKNWLIRTKTNHILGPVSKEKVLELYQNGSIKTEDEVCSGNGFWFYIRETDLVERFLTGDEIQGFNPISEAKDVLTIPGHSEIHSQEDDITRIGGVDMSDYQRDLSSEPVQQAAALATDQNDASHPKPKKKAKNSP